MRIFREASGAMGFRLFKAAVESVRRDAND